MEWRQARITCVDEYSIFRRSRLHFFLFYILFQCHTFSFIGDVKATGDSRASWWQGAFTKGFPMEFREKASFDYRISVLGEGNISRIFEARKNSIRSVGGRKRKWEKKKDEEMGTDRRQEGSRKDSEVRVAWPNNDTPGFNLSVARHDAFFRKPLLQERCFRKNIGKERDSLKDGNINRDRAKGTFIRTVFSSRVFFIGSAWSRYTLAATENLSTNCYRFYAPRRHSFVFTHY